MGILFAERTVVLEAEAEVQGVIVQEVSALDRQAGDPYYWAQGSADQ